MIVTEAGMHPNVAAIVYITARASDVGEDYSAPAKRFPKPPASAGIVFDIACQNISLEPSSLR
jgi:hypothetical protein